MMIKRLSRKNSGTDVPNTAKMPKMMVANTLIQDYLRRKNKAAFIDVYHAMVTPDNKPMTDIFKEDSLHMNAKGYAIWQKTIEPYLLK